MYKKKDEYNSKMKAFVRLACDSIWVPATVWSLLVKVVLFTLRLFGSILLLSLRGQQMTVIKVSCQRLLREFIGLTRMVESKAPDHKNITHEAISRGRSPGIALVIGMHRIHQSKSYFTRIYIWKNARISSGVTGNFSGGTKRKRRVCVPVCIHYIALMLHVYHF